MRYLVIIIMRIKSQNYDLPGRNYNIKSYNYDIKSLNWDEVTNYDKKLK